jgi:putative IMPACT (imprinted ancient) family translation regulator
MRFSDDREPQGTAGLPVLDCIRKGGYVDVAIVVTRYFGGVLLGTGGLVHAYTAAAQGAIKSAGVAKYDLYRRIEITVSYSDYQKITMAISESGFRVSNTFYKEDVVIEGSILSVNSAALCDSLVQLTAARVVCKVGEEIFDC